MYTPRVQSLLSKLKISNPIIQAPMANGPSTPALVVAVSSAGGLGSLAFAHGTPQQMREQIKITKESLGDKPYAVNVFIPPSNIKFDKAKLEKMREAMTPFYRQVGVENLPPILESAPDLQKNFNDQIEVVLEQKVPVFSFTFGIPSKEIIQKLQANGTFVIGTANTVREAQAVEAAGCDAVVAQGHEAGGHRTTFIDSPTDLSSNVGMLTLVTAVSNSVKIPVIAAGGIMNGANIAAALMQGASAVQMGTAFMLTPEAGTNKPHRAAMAKATEESTVLTRGFTGRYARGIKNQFIEFINAHPELVNDWSIQINATSPMSQQAIKTGNSQFMPLFSGQGVGMCREMPAAEMVKVLQEEYVKAVQVFRG